MEAKRNPTSVWVPFGFHMSLIYETAVILVCLHIISLFFFRHFIKYIINGIRVHFYKVFFLGRSHSKDQIISLPLYAVTILAELFKVIFDIRICELKYRSRYGNLFQIFMALKRKQPLAGAGIVVCQYF